MPAFQMRVYEGNQISNEATLIAADWSDASKQAYGLVYGLEAHSVDGKITRIVIEGPPSRRMDD